MSLPTSLVRHSRQFYSAMVSVAVGAAALAVPAITMPTQAATPIVVSPSADAYVSSGAPTSNYGTGYALAAKAPSSADTTSLTSYIKFDVTGFPATAGNVVLRLQTYSSHPGFLAATAANGWNESTITYANAPAPDRTLGAFPDASHNTWTELDVSSVVTGNGTYTFAITTSETSKKSFASRETGSNASQLVMTAAPSPSPTTTTTSPTETSPSPTASASGTPSPTETSPSSTVSASGTPTPTATQEVSFVAHADSYVQQANPQATAGSSYVLYAQADDGTGTAQRTYVKIAVTGLPGTVRSAQLRLYSYSTSKEGLDIATAGNDWTEDALTWSAAPAPGPVLASAKPIGVNTWVAADVTSTVIGDGTYTFVIATSRQKNNKVASRESAYRPELVVMSDVSSTTSPSPTGTPTSASPTSSPTSPSPTGTPTSASPTSSPTSPSPTGTGDPTIVAAGDIACKQGALPTASNCQQQATSDLAVALAPSALLPLGDNQYELGSLSDYRAMYAPSWGRLDSIARPVPGNHEYGYIGSAVQPTGGTGYFTYFGNRSHPLQPGCSTLCTSWYSYDVGDWHLIALDSQCGVIGGCNSGNPEYNWLANDLKSHSNACTLAYWHIPIYSSSHDRQPDMANMYKLLYEHGADVVLNGHAHFYERFAPQDSAGNLDRAGGIREFLVGTGGRSFFNISATPQANSEVRIANTFGVLEMTLHPNAYSWRFVPVPGSTSTDSGSATCH